MNDLAPATDAYAPTESASALVHILDDYVAALEKGASPDPAAVLAAHPELASQLESCLAALDFIHRTERPAGPTPTRLGDFQIVREIGRGGMGVVYEAEQVSLKRRVALKVLRFGASPDVDALQRFQREAETVARLHHTNIVPVFAVGCEQGVHYYAMQFIEGKSLDKVSPGQVAGCEEAARWGVQAAEALAHAHTRGVIHRDIKPSNLLLDGEGVVWLTDFGLARRADEVALTATGLLLGTPRYMSPEQASSARQPVGERSDIYSLGATLYELAAGAPVYDGETPQRVIAQILEGELTPPRQHRLDMPRDLETILLKCLAREQTRRYPTAQSLADDLRRFLNGDPLQARDPSLRERAGRWLNRHRRSVQVALGAALVALAATLGVLMSMSRVERWLQGRLFLSTDGPVLTAEVLTPADTPASPRFTVPTEEPVILAAGDYHLRLRGRGFLDETFQVRIERGRERAFDVSLAEQRPWEPLAVPRCCEVFAIDGRTDLFVLSDEGVSRRNGGTGELVWTANLNEKSDPRMKGFRWLWNTQASPSGRGDKDRRPQLLQPGPDLDGDGVPDLVWTSRRQAAVLAMSGKDGRVLWCWQAPLRKFPPDSRFQEAHASTGIVLGTSAVLDLDGDGTLDPIVTCTQQTQADGSVPRWVTALSGRTGASLYRFDLDPRWLTPAAGETVPDGSLWNNMLGLGSSSSSGHQSHPNLLYPKDFTLAQGGLPVPFPAVVLRTEGRDALVLTAGRHVVSLDPRSGRPRGPGIDLGFWPLRTPQFADVDGDGRVEVVALGSSTSQKPAANPIEGLPANDMSRLGISFPPDDDCLTLTAVAMDTGRPLWCESLRGYWGWNWFQEPFEWPLVADLDDDGLPEILVPTGDFAGETKWSGVEVREGSTGVVRWQRKVMRASRYGELLQVNRMLVGPDIDGDGVRDLFATVLDGREHSADRPFSSIRVLNFDKDYSKPILRVDALSGKDGRALWWSVFPVRHGSLTTSPRPSVDRLFWWHTGDDGWPQLVVPYVPGQPQGNDYPHETFVVSAGTGRLARRSSDLRELRTADLDGDGVAELLSFQPERSDAPDQGGRLLAVRGRSPEAWRRLGGHWQRIADLDGDGLPDLLSVPLPNESMYEERPRHREAALRPKDIGDKTLTQTRSSRDGRLLWETEITEGKSLSNWERSRYERVVSADCDLDGDGITDLLATGKTHCNYMSESGFSPLVAVSGKTGRFLWAADIRVTLWNGPQLLECRDLDGDGRPEVLFVSASDWDWPRGANGARSTNDWQYWLAVLDGATGLVKWRQPLCERNTTSTNGGPARVPFSFAVADLDGDGSLDLVTEGGLAGGDGEVHAFRGRDGEPLWVGKLPSLQIDNNRSSPTRLTLATGELNGRRVVAVLRVVTRKGQKGHDVPFVEVVALDAARGDVQWTWQHEVGSQYNDLSNGAVRSRVGPFFIRQGAGGQALGVWIGSHGDPGQVILLDGRGQEIRRRPIAFRLGNAERRLQRSAPQNRYSPVYSDLFQIWCHDLDGDGIDELLALTNDRLVVWAGDLSAERWSWPLPDVECGLLDVVPAAEGRPGRVTLRAGNRVVGLGGADGRLLWSCAGSGTPRALVAAESGETLPVVLYDLGDQVTVCRRTQPPGDMTSTIGFVPYTPPGDEDPREVRRLPWNALEDLPPLFPASPWGIALVAAFLAWAVLVVPWWGWRAAVRQRRPSWGLLTGVWLGLIWGGVCMLYLVMLNDDASYRISQKGWLLFATSLGRQTLTVAPWGVPLVVFATVALRLAFQRSWKLLFLLILGSGLCAALVAVVWLRLASAEVDDRPFSRRGWLGVAPAGTYAVGAVLLVGWLGQSVVRVVRRLRRRPAVSLST